ncbi:ABC transporter permease [Actinomadura madurae]|uniref:ABC transporter permease n=1 Tax=Actinomadura madurae TaxID=1993 RepID=UPI0020D23DA2|nr:ABC transporter permease [Actinomadura madurae]MCP9966247.1 ABC transporter permease [Actinomadura madurae]
MTDPKLNPYRLAEGRAPRAPNEVVINKMFADEGDLRIGDRTAVLTPEKVPVTVVGISMFGDEEAFGETSFTAFSLEGARRHVAKGTDRITGVAVRARDGVSQDELASRIRPVVPAGAEAVTTEAAVEEGMSLVESGFLQVFRVVLASFGGVALLVAAFSIHNTFAITVAQRTRESALLRALGAGRRQVLTIVGFEALVIGGAATLAGLAGRDRVRGPAPAALHAVPDRDRDGGAHGRRHLGHDRGAGRAAGHPGRGARPRAEGVADAAAGRAARGRRRDVPAVGDPRHRRRRVRRGRDRHRRVRRGHRADGDGGGRRRGDRGVDGRARAGGGPPGRGAARRPRGAAARRPRDAGARQRVPQPGPDGPAPRPR